MNNKKGLFMLIVSMLLFGTIGIFRKYIPLGSGTVAVFRAWIGCVFLFGMLLLQKKRIRVEKKTLPLLCISGAAIGFNWILLFEAYRYVSVATATLCYYMAPVIVIAASPFVLKEKLNLKKICCVISAILGVIPVSGILSDRTVTDIRGILFGLGAAILYASVILFNKRLQGVGAFDRTLLQLAFAGAVLLPYVLLTEKVSIGDYTPKVIFLLLIVGIIHTGVAYVLYFASLEKLKAQTAALYSYIDPISAILLSAVILGELPGVMTVVGAVLILGAAVVSDLGDST